MGDYLNLQKLNSRHMMIAYLDATGKGAKEIAAITGYNANYVSSVRQLPIYRTALATIRRQIEERVVNETADLAVRFNKGAPRAVDVVEEIMLDQDPHKPVSPSTRLKAAQTWLDRSSNVPRVKQEKDTDGAIHIHFGARATDNIREALSDTGQTDLLEVMEAEIVESPDAKGASATPTESLPAPVPEIVATPIEDVADDEEYA